MRPYFGMLIGGLVIASTSNSWADDTSMVMCEQFAIAGATMTVEPVTQLDEVFSPAHHAPRNIPIEVKLPADAHAFIHFPILEAGNYVIYATNSERLAGLEHKGGDTIKTSTAAAPDACSTVLTGGLTSDLTEHPTGPVPIAIEFHEGSAETVGLIISRDPIN